MDPANQNELQDTLIARKEIVEDESQTEKKILSTSGVQHATLEDRKVAKLPNSELCDLQLPYDQQNNWQCGGPVVQPNTISVSQQLVPSGQKATSMCSMICEDMLLQKKNSSVYTPLPSDNTSIDSPSEDLTNKRNSIEISSSSEYYESRPNDNCSNIMCRMPPQETVGKEKQICKDHLPSDKICGDDTNNTAKKFVPSQEMSHGDFQLSHKTYSSGKQQSTGIHQIMGDEGSSPGMNLYETPGLADQTYGNQQFGAGNQRQYTASPVAQMQNCSSNQKQQATNQVHREQHPVAINLQPQTPYLIAGTSGNHGYRDHVQQATSQIVTEQHPVTSNLGQYTSESVTQTLAHPGDSNHGLQTTSPIAVAKAGASTVEQYTTVLTAETLGHPGYRNHGQQQTSSMAGANNIAQHTSGLVETGHPIDSNHGQQIISPTAEQLHAGEINIAQHIPGLGATLRHPIDSNHGQQIPNQIAGGQHAGASNLAQYTPGLGATLQHPIDSNHGQQIPNQIAGASNLAQYTPGLGATLQHAINCNHGQQVPNQIAGGQHAGASNLAQYTPGSGATLRHPIDSNHEQQVPNQIAGGQHAGASNSAQHTVASLAETLGNHGQQITSPIAGQLHAGAINIAQHTAGRGDLGYSNHRQQIAGGQHDGASNLGHHGYSYPWQPTANQVTARNISHHPIDTGTYNKQVMGTGAPSTQLNNTGMNLPTGQKDIYVRDLPYDVVNDVKKSLDSSPRKDWTQLASQRHMSYHRVINIKNEANQMKESPTEHLLNEPEFQNYTLSQLEQDLQAIGRVDTVSQLKLWRQKNQL